MAVPIEVAKISPFTPVILIEVELFERMKDSLGTQSGQGGKDESGRQDLGKFHAPLVARRSNAVNREVLAAFGLERASSTKPNAPVSAVLET